MTKQMSFSKQEHNVIPEFRQSINTAESTEEIKKFFTYTAMKLMDDVFNQDLNFEFEDITLAPDSTKKFIIHERFYKMDQFREIWDHSDLNRILKSFAETSIHKYKHLAGSPEKTELKIRK